MEKEPGVFDNGEEPRPLTPGERWLADAVNLPGFTEDYARLLEKLSPAALDSLQLRRQAYMETNGGADYIADQLVRVLQLFGSSRQA